MSSEPLDAGRELATVGPSVSAFVADARRGLRQALGRGADGRYVRGNADAGGSLERSVQLQDGLAPLRDAIADTMLSDLGESRADASQALLMTVRDIALLELMEENFLAYEMERAAARGDGVAFITAKGKTTASFSKLLTIIDRKAKLIAAIGLERKARDARHLSAEEYIRQTTAGAAVEGPR